MTAQRHHQHHQHSGRLFSGFDLLEEFRLSESTGVRVVEGSEPDAVAYRINPSLHLSKTMSDVYPDGLPTDYSIIATFKMTKDAAHTSWNLWQVSDAQGQEQVGLRLRGDSRSLDFFYVGPRGVQMLRTFDRAEKLFDGEWHKLALSVKGGEAKLLVDCEEVSAEPIDEPRPVIRQGYTSIVKRAARDRSRDRSRDRTTQVDVQKMQVSCDADNAYSEGCCELSNVCGGYAEIGLTAGRATCRCAHGQPGVQGRAGPKGHRGFQGNPGDTGRLGNWGIRGATGAYGNVGETGPKGDVGIKGEKGRRGIYGQESKAGLVAMDPLDPKGLRVLLVILESVELQARRGHLELWEILVCQEEMGILVWRPTKDHRAGKAGLDKAEDGVRREPWDLPGTWDPKAARATWDYLDARAPRLVTEALQDSRACRGCEGKVGIPVAKDQWEPKASGAKEAPMASRVHQVHLQIKFHTHVIKAHGPTLPAQHVIEVCKRVVLEQMSTFANSVKRTCAAVCPLYGDVPMGAPGPAGQKGPPGPPGEPGIDGVDGEVGQQGFYGEAGDPGRPGSRGETGEPGDKGAKGYGLPGYMGDQGAKGQRGRPGRVFNGRPGEMGERGHVGRPGLRGHPGLRGVPGVCLTSGCADLAAASGNGAPRPQTPVPETEPAAVASRPASRPQPQSPRRFRGRG
ncbi:hypothetical protein ACEWY4_021221 [Coilia grayii]|uniref:Thrombospondin-like N-terminal domain-containing protein n=1 Tax=Coilia grayii TaxID=363190 RepID=A0ABD1JBP5_9TELE